jgi:uncharacterized protein GlcG (DUF336 family)
VKNRLTTFLGTLASGLALSVAPAAAQGAVSQPTVSLLLAKAMADAALAECASKGFHTAVAVVDRSGQLLVLLRDDQASPLTIEMARRKAYTAALFRTSTLDFQKRTQEDPSAAPMRNVGEVLALGGGVPIRIDNQVVGGIASSGSSQPQDDACAKAGLLKLTDAPR